jgi:transposase
VTSPAIGDISDVSGETIELLPNLSHLQIFHLNSEMASEDPNPVPDSDPYQAPTLALKQALCFSCWDVSSNLSRCSACKRVSYCSAKCQKQDWNRNHKKICKKLVALNKQKGYVPSAGRHWNDYYDEQVRCLARRASRF